MYATKRLKINFNNMKNLLLFLAIALTTNFSHAQTGPGGVGNASGADGQPENVMWFDANSLGLANGTGVETWTDLSGNDNHAAQTESSERPIFTTGEINGLPAVVFDGSDDFLPFDGNLIANSDYTVIFVGKRQSDAGLRAFLGGTTSSGNR